jgi:hypothetical protein
VENCANLEKPSFRRRQINQRSHHCCSKYVVLEKSNDLKISNWSFDLRYLGVSLKDESFAQPEDFDDCDRNSKHHRDKLGRVSCQVPANLGSSIFPTF